MSAGKGDSPRPITLAIYHKNYDKIFRKQKLPSGYNPEMMPIADIECQECLEQSRLLGMSAERECDLRGKIDQIERERDEWKQKFIQQNKDLKCEMMDPSGTIWDYASALQRENVQLKREIEALEKAISYYIETAKQL